MTTEFVKHKGIKRIVYAYLNSYRGLIWLCKNEAAFRQELAILSLLAPLSFFLEVSPLERAALIAVLFLVLIIEVLNTAIETAIDRIGPEYHELSGVAKDLASTAVFLTMLLAAAVWAVILFS